MREIVNLSYDALAGDNSVEEEKQCSQCSDGSGGHRPEQRCPSMLAAPSAGAAMHAN